VNEESPALHQHRDFGLNGTFIVYRKLYQNVAAWWNFWLEKSKEGNPDPNPEYAVFLASKAVGRWPSGAPLTLSPDKDTPELGRDKKKRDDFLYFEKDKEGYGTPLASHVRRTNPRDHRFMNEDDKFALNASDKHRIIRRTTFYGGQDIFPRDDVEHHKFPAEIKDDGQDRGAQFLGINANIRGQFEFIQVDWSNNTNFEGLNQARDAMSQAIDGTTQFEFPTKRGRILIKNIPNFITLRGGGYFFMPSLTSLRYMAETPISG
jgi:deferrochelatase/peroxidase EfeB